jgi:hypothetical protein
LYDDFGVGIFLGDGERLLSEQFYVFLHAPLGLIKAVFDGVTDSGETFKVGRVKSKKRWIIRCFDHQRVLEIYHDISPYFPFKPASAVTQNRPLKVTSKPANERSV